ncbi:uncharacterized protein KY384_001411 [Bacidia gigantensis]|uniref:uncharacterized protein n=1 Tax=Bacidia gigantensis TaxID=2732470 RepID=UPI001D048068|nr:uncharacterized protein KY384_001411 [Bacidia gigantensis]KAG8533670.1 hypothetical protein KY384_001411 [Bacidia gigantensis]
MQEQSVGADSITQFKQFFVQYEGLIEGWLSQATGGTNTSNANVASPSRSQNLGAESSPTAAADDAGTVPSSTNSSFNPQATNNVAVYWGAAEEAEDVDLMQICHNPWINIVNLAFITAYRGTKGLPTINLGAACSMNITRNGTVDPGIDPGKAKTACRKTASAIQTCQANNKKVMLSVGGEIGKAKIDFNSTKDATDAADYLWDLFGGGTGLGFNARPFGNITVDGFDVDTENKLPQHYTEFVQALRSKMDAQRIKKYFISAAPQCPIPDQSIPLDAMHLMDFVWVQFYNNPECLLGSGANFTVSFHKWSADLSKNGTIKGPQLYIGAPACPVPKCSGSGYVEPAKLTTTVQAVKHAKNFGGIMLWEGSRSVLDDQYAKVAKVAIGA